jgi:hypothetical protein
MQPPLNSCNMLPLFDYLEQFHPLSNEFRADYEKNCTLIQVKKNKYIISPIDHNTSLYFLVIGLVRGFIKDGKKDISTWFSFGNEIIGALRHPDVQLPNSIEYLQALEHSQLIAIPYSLLEATHTKYAEANVISRKLLALRHHAASDRAILARIPNASKRYQKLEISNLAFDKIPKRYLASYLGMRLETLCRIGSKFLAINPHISAIE